MWQVLKENNTRLVPTSFLPHHLSLWIFSAHGVCNYLAGLLRDTRHTSSDCLVEIKWSSACEQAAIWFRQARAEKLLSASDNVTTDIVLLSLFLLFCFGSQGVLDTWCDRKHRLESGFPCCFWHPRLNVRYSSAEALDRLDLLIVFCSDSCWMYILFAFIVHISSPAF